MSLDILSALGASPRRGNNRCGLGKWLDAIPEDTIGRDELVRLAETMHDRKAEPETRSGRDMAVILSRLGYVTSSNPILDHRNHACACYR